jgi:hypothetical protein
MPCHDTCQIVGQAGDLWRKREMRGKGARLLGLTCKPIHGVSLSGMAGPCVIRTTRNIDIE